jgi:hypothetical protein
VQIPEANVGDLISGFLGYDLPLRGWAACTLGALLGGSLLWLGIRHRRRWARFVGCVVIVLGVLALVVDLLVDRDLALGPLPTGTPVSLIANLDPLKLRAEAPGLVDDFIAALREAKKLGTPEEKMKYLGRELWPVLKKLSKAPDFVLNRGHLFGTGLPQADKEALIEFLKTL